MTSYREKTKLTPRRPNQTSYTHDRVEGSLTCLEHFGTFHVSGNDEVVDFN